MWIELSFTSLAMMFLCLNPYSNGMWIEPVKTEDNPELKLS